MNICEKLTFGELKVGMRFIAFPSPGDNSGHGGYRIKYYIFEKTIPVGTEIEGYFNNAKRVGTQVPSRYPDTMPVIRVE